MGATWDQLSTTAKPPAPAEAPDAHRYNDLCAAVFTSAAGKELMILMRARTIEMRSRPGAPEAELREHEAMRRFVADIETACERGLKARTKPA